MSKELLEAAKAVLDVRADGGVVNWWRVDARKIAALRAAVERAEAEPDVIERNGRRFVRTGEVRRPRKDEWFVGDYLPAVIAICDEAIEFPILRELPAAPSDDDARVAEAMNAVADVVFQKGYTPTQTTLNTIADALRPYVLPSPAPQPGTVAVEVSVLRDSLNHVCSNPNCHPCAAYRAKIESILPPTPPSPSEADWKRWREEAKALSVGQGLFGSHEEHIWRDGYIARAEAEWRGKNGGNHGQ